MLARAVMGVVAGGGPARAQAGEFVLQGGDGLVHALLVSCEDGLFGGGHGQLSEFGVVVVGDDGVNTGPGQDV